MENNSIGNIILTAKGDDANESLYIMRHQMLSNHKYVAGVFIGGMNGVEDEYNMFKTLQPKAQLIPVASTGAAAKIIYEREKVELMFSDRLESDLAYFSLFKDLLGI